MFRWKAKKKTKKIDDYSIKLQDDVNSSIEQLNKNHIIVTFIYYLRDVDEMKEKLDRVLLSFGRKFRMIFTDQSFEHWRFDGLFVTGRRRRRFVRFHLAIDRRFRVTSRHHTDGQFTS